MLKNGDIIAVSGASWLSRAIQYFQKKGGEKWYLYNHVGIYWNFNGTEFIIEAQANGICLNTFNKKKYSKIIACNYNEKIGNKIVENALKFVDKSNYDYFNLLISQPIKMLTGGKVWIGEKKQDYSFTCSEFVTFIYNYTFKPNRIFIDELKAAPCDILECEKFTKTQIK